jgi:hypothetical protein
MRYYEPAPCVPVGVEEGGELAGAYGESPALGCPAPQQGELVGGHQQAGLPGQEHLLLLLLQIDKEKLIFFPLNYRKFVR